MNLELLSPAALGAVAAALAAGVLGLHLLRVRLRRVTVDSLLFFRMVGEVQRPRVLGARPARWLSFLLLLLAALALALAAARPVQRGTGPSQVVVVDWTRADADYAARATELAAAGLGPEGRVLAFAERTWTVLEAGEAPELVATRLDPTVAGGGPAALWPALEVAGSGLDSADRIVVLGGPAELPGELAGVPLRRDLQFADAPGRPRICRMILDAADGLHEWVDVATGGAELTLRLLVDGDEVVVRQVTSPPRGATRVRLGPLPARECTVQVELGDGLARTERREADRSPLPVQLAAGLPAAVARAVAADPRLVAAGPGSEPARLVVATRPDPVLPTLVLESGVDAGAARIPLRTDDCPLPLSLRDRQGDAPALVGTGDDETVWVEDAAQGAALVAARTGDPVTPAQVRATSWLLDDAAHRDVPLLVSGSLRWLGGILTPTVETPTFHAPPPTDEPADDAQPVADDERFDDPTDLGIALLVLALLILAGDAWLFGRGRLP